MLKWNDIVNFANNNNPIPAHKVVKTPSQWRQQLNEEQFYVTRSKGTERPYAQTSCSLLQPGKYACVCCDNVLFDAGTKFESGSGWPAFTQPATINAIAYIDDSSHGMERIEVICNVCDAHLGHIFPDGPVPSGLRYCVNGIAIKLI